MLNKLKLQVLVLMLISSVKTTARMVSHQHSLSPSRSKRLFIIRHGQAQHNPRAEEARDKGCSHERFLELIEEDDALDAELTPLGREQAGLLYNNKSFQEKMKCVDLVISSPLSRALQTADIALPGSSYKNVRRISLETFREINGWLLNAKRRDIDDLKMRFDGWNFDDLDTNEDNLWTKDLESQSSCGERGYQGLLFVAREREEENVLVVSHGGLLRYSLVSHPLIKLECGRTSQSPANHSLRSIEARFSNCEIREYEMFCGEGVRPLITLREVTDFNDIATVEQA